LQNKSAYIIILISCLILKTNAQFLDKHYYLVDSIERNGISKEDREFLDEQIKKYNNTSSDTVKIQTLMTIVEEIRDEKIWIKYNRLMSAIAAEKVKTAKGREYFVFKVAEALALNNFGYYYFNYSTNQNLALGYYNKGLLINEDLKNYRYLISSYSNMGNVYQSRGDLNKALEYYQKSLALENKVPEKLLFLAPLNNLAQVYLYLNDTIKAIQTLKKAFVQSAGSSDKFIRGSLLHNIGVLSYSNRTKPGIQAIYTALALRKEIGDRRGIIQTNLTLAGIETKKGNYLLAEQHIKEAVSLIGEFKDTQLEALYYYQLSNIKEATGKQDEAIAYGEKSVAIYKKFSMGIELADALRNLIQLYGENDKKYALKKLEAYELLQKVVMNIDKATAQKSLLRQKYEEDLKINEARFKLEEQLKEEKNSADKHKQQLILTGVSIILLIVIIFSFFIFKALKENQKKNKIILEQNVKVEKQKQLIEEKHKDITDSINYAQKIQTALIISEKTLSAKVENVFVMFKPRDVVSGDFYWYTEKNGYKLLAVADCTGHGVPGAFMSMIGITLLNQIVREKGITSPSKILNELRDGIISSLNQTKEEASERDGMDVSLIAWNKQELIYAGANNPCVVFSNKEIIELKPDKQPVGLYEKQESFNEQKLDIKTVESIYLFTDGIVDQFGGENGKKIKIKLFKEWLKDIAGSDSRTQKTKLEKKFTDWKMNHTQTDDILVIGIKA
jgi:serine phosphatase RsbU (regulator of sigma subunit)